MIKSDRIVARRLENRAGAVAKRGGARGTLDGTRTFSVAPELGPNAPREQSMQFPSLKPARSASARFCCRSRKIESDRNRREVQGRRHAAGKVWCFAGSFQWNPTLFFEGCLCDTEKVGSYAASRFLQQ
jgi:hypothetical protein